MKNNLVRRQEILLSGNFSSEYGYFGGCRAAANRPWSEEDMDHVTESASIIAKLADPSPPASFIHLQPAQIASPTNNFHSTAI
ncbi:hypothetical protein SAY86_030220 [Trapa natans]|uniref:Uncharacterized protein n=1 Tax=Trapa natans TaxID=22666 RepID=A0AAN7M4V8_TRANT|nr:hypothetical protein SAY86_030220 [Trapa natans]